MKKIYKLQAIGGSYYIALPKEWLKRFSLDKGSHVEISVEPDGTLKIRPAEALTKDMDRGLESAVEVEVKDKDTIYTLLISLYLEGYDVITLRFSDSSTIQTIRNAIGKAKNILLGFEIIDEDSSSIVLRVLTSSEADIMTIIRNMNKIARSMYLDVLVALVDKDIAKAYEVEARDQDLNRLYFYTTRVIRKKVIVSIEPRENLRLLDLRMIARSVEEIGDEAKKAAKIVQDILLSDAEVDLRYVGRLRGYVEELDTVYRNAINKLDKVSPLPELIELLHKCEKTRAELSSLRREAVEQIVKGSVYLSELTHAYENIAKHIYDIISLCPTST